MRKAAHGALYGLLAGILTLLLTGLTATAETDAVTLGTACAKTLQQTTNAMVRRLSVAIAFLNSRWRQIAAATVCFLPLSASISA